MPAPDTSILIIGAGIVGLGTALALTARGERSVTVIDKERELAQHQTGRNSGVIHAGLYYRPGSLKATLCREGRDRLEAFCTAHAVPFERCGKLVVATDEAELPRLDQLAGRGRANGLAGIEVLGPQEMQRVEPFVRGVRALFVPQTGIVDYAEVCRTYARVFRERGGRLILGAAFTAARRDAPALSHRTRGGAVSDHPVHLAPRWIIRTDSRSVPEIVADAVINCAGLHADRIARALGARPSLRIVPFRGEYHELAPYACRLVRNLIYPVPDPRFPFLGVHFTRMIRGGVEAGPNAVPALRREGYTWRDISLRDCAETLGYVGFRRLARRHWRMGAGEIHRSLSRRAFHRALARFIPDLACADLRPARAGVRAQALAPDGSLIDDFAIESLDGAIHVLNAPSPAATASLAIGERIADLVRPV